MAEKVLGGVFSLIRIIDINKQECYPDFLDWQHAGIIKERLDRSKFQPIWQSWAVKGDDIHKESMQQKRWCLLQEIGCQPVMNTSNEHQICHNVISFSRRTHLKLLWKQMKWDVFGFGSSSKSIFPSTCQSNQAGWVMDGNGRMKYK